MERRKGGKLLCTMTLFVLLKHGKFSTTSCCFLLVILLRYRFHKRIRTTQAKQPPKYSSPAPLQLNSTCNKNHQSNDVAHFISMKLQKTKNVKLLNNLRPETDVEAET